MMPLQVRLIMEALRYRNIPVEIAYLIAKSILNHSLVMCPQNAFTIFAVPVVSWLQVLRKVISREEIYLVLVTQSIPYLTKN